MLNVQTGDKVNGTIKAKFCRFLLSYHTTPQATTGETPAQLRWDRKLRAQVDLLMLSVVIRIETDQARQTFQNDQHCKSRSFEVGHTVSVCIYSGNQKWSYGTVVECRRGSRVVKRITWST